MRPPREAVASLAAPCPGGTLAHAPLEVVGLRMHMSGGGSSPWGVSWMWGRGAWRRCSETRRCGALFGVFLFLCSLFCSHRQLWLSRPPLRPFHVEVEAAASAVSQVQTHCRLLSGWSQESSSSRPASSRKPSPRSRNFPSWLPSFEEGPPDGGPSDRRGAEAGVTQRCPKRPDSLSQEGDPSCPSHPTPPSM